MNPKVIKSLRAIPLTILLVLAATVAVQAQWSYIAEGEDTAIIGDYSGPGGAVAIPATIDGYQVVSIGFGEESVFPNTVVTSVTIPDSVSSIGASAFEGCTDLTSITIPSSVGSIGADAFAFCGLTNVTIPTSITSIEQGTFQDCQFLSSVTIPSSVTSIGQLAFDYCISLTNVTIPHSVTSIGANAFEHCSNLTSATIGGGVTNIGEYAFGYCSNLVSVTIGAGVTSLGDYSFAFCGGLTGVYFQGNAPIADATAFAGDNNVTAYYLQGTTGWGATFAGISTAPWSFGSLLVSITPPAAVSAGAHWQVDGGARQDSGATISGLVVGKHTVSFNTVNGWTTPGNQIVVVSANSKATTSGTYVATGSLQVTITPAAAVIAGAQWQVDGGTPESSDETVGNLSAGNHTVSFNAVSGWTTPPDQTVSIKAKSVAKAKGTYTFSAQGIYNGLFMQADVTEETAGMLSGLDVTASGTYSGKLLIGGGSYAISGGFNVSGQASNYVQRTAKLGGPLALETTLNWNDSPPNITGTVSGTIGGLWMANLTNELAATGSKSAEYTALVLPDGTPGTPPGYGYILITNHAGTVTLSVTLADGTSFSQVVPVSSTGELPVYGKLYSGTGLLLGWLGLESGSPAGNLTWIKPASRSIALYTNGFTNLAVVQGSLWTNPLPHTAAIDLPSGQLEIAGGSLPSPMSFNVAVGNNNALVKLPGSPTNSLSGSINPKTGLLTITFGNGAGRATTAGKGAVIQNASEAGGFFSGRTNAGSMLLRP
jgi:hypothetical protein